MTETKKDFIDLTQFNKDELIFLIEDGINKKNISAKNGMASVDEDACAKDKILATISALEKSLIEFPPFKT